MNRGESDARVRRGLKSGEKSKKLGELETNRRKVYC
jgi:hypothetical protein